MSRVTLDAEATDQFARLPSTMKARVATVFERLENWPSVSGAKALRGELAGQYRIRTGDYRVQFRVAGDEVIVERIGHRDGFYDG